MAARSFWGAESGISGGNIQSQGEDGSNREIVTFFLSPGEGWDGGVMLGERYTEKCRVNPGDRVILDELSTTTLGVLGKPEEEALPIFQQLRGKLSDQQKGSLCGREAEGSFGRAGDGHRRQGRLCAQALLPGGPAGCESHAIQGPSTRELSHDFLWRVHQVVPANGEIAVFNRSHYEDIIAVRVKNLAPDEVWERRYKHIVDFEQMLVDEGTTILKFSPHFQGRAEAALGVATGTAGKALEVLSG